MSWTVLHDRRCVVMPKLHTFRANETLVVFSPRTLKDALLLADTSMWQGGDVVWFSGNAAPAAIGA